MSYKRWKASTDVTEFLEPQTSNSKKLGCETVKIRERNTLISYLPIKRQKTELKHSNHKAMQKYKILRNRIHKKYVGHM